MKTEKFSKEKLKEKEEVRERKPLPHLGFGPPEPAGPAGRPTPPPRSLFPSSCSTDPVHAPSAPPPHPLAGVEVDKGDASGSPFPRSSSSTPLDASSILPSLSRLSLELSPSPPSAYDAASSSSPQPPASPSPATEPGRCAVLRFIVLVHQLEPGRSVTSASPSSPSRWSPAINGATCLLLCSRTPRGLRVPAS